MQKTGTIGKVTAKLGGVAGASAFVLGSRLLAVGAGFLCTVFVARWFGKEALGFVTLLTSFSVVFAMVASFGLGTFLMKELSAKSDSHGPQYARGIYLKSLAVVLVAAAVLMVVVLPVFMGRVPEFAKAGPLPVAVLAGLAMLAQTLFQLHTQVIRGLQRIVAFGATFAAPPLAYLTIIFLAGRKDAAPSPYLPSYAYTLTIAVTAAIGLAFIVRAISQMPAQKGDSAYDVPRAGTMLSESRHFFMSALAALLITDGNVILTSYFVPTADLGLYSVAVKVSMLTGFALTSVNLVVGPRFAQLSQTSTRKTLTDFARSAAKLVFWATAPILLGVLLLGKWLVLTFFGPDYLPAVVVLLILTAGQFVNAFTGVTDAFLNMTGGHRVLVAITWLAVGVNVLLSLLLAPAFGITGAGIALAASVTVWNLGALIAIRRREGVWLCYIPFASKGPQA